MTVLKLRVKPKVKRFISSSLSALFLSGILLSASSSYAMQENPYSDVSKDDWYYTCVTELYRDSIAPQNDFFYPEFFDLRGNFIYLIYRAYVTSGGEWEETRECPFDDVDKNMYYYGAVCWANEKGISSGVDDGHFAPEAQITKEQACTILMRSAALLDMKLEKKGNEEQFEDSLKISPYARSSVSACKIAGIVNGDENGKFNPQSNIKRAESASMIYSLLQSIVKKPDKNGEYVDTSPGAYDYLYDSYKSAFTPLVPQSEAVDISYFDDAVLIGDSVTLSLSYYAASSGSLGKAQFLCAGSLSPINALWDVSSASVHPTYRGKKMRVEDSVAASGAKKVYIMLGINAIALGMDNSVQSMKTLVDLIKEKSPDAHIIIESVTPMARGSTISSSKLNNKNIAIFNQRLLELCEENEWYFINVAEVFTDSEGYLMNNCCSDPNNMGIHFTQAADEIWINYLKTHVPEELK